MRTPRMIFNEIYGAYYNTVSKIIKKAVENRASSNDIRNIIMEYAYSESVITIESALRDERWQLIKCDGTTPIKHVPTIPLTELQKRWLKAVSLDLRIKLFDCDFSFLEDVKPLFTPEDYYIFDKYSDGDNYNDDEYIKNFRMILNAVKLHQTLEIVMNNRKGNTSKIRVIPEYLEYSEKDDKFRLITSGNRFGKTINLSRIIRCEYCDINISQTPFTPNGNEVSLTLMLTDRRNTLERVMLHFSHFKKEAVKIDEDNYKLRIYYSKDDETELLIRILSFGPTVKVIEPESFVELIKDRLYKQKSCEL